MMMMVVVVVRTRYLGRNSFMLYRQLWHPGHVSVLLVVVTWSRQNRVRNRYWPVACLFTIIMLL